MVRGSKYIGLSAELVPRKKLGSPLFNLEKIKNSDKKCFESQGTHWTVIHEEEIGSLKIWKLKHGRGDQIIQASFKVGRLQKLGPHFLICRTLKTLVKALLNYGECIEI